MKTWTVELSGGLQRVSCSVEVEAETQEEARRKAKEKAIEGESWEIGYGQRVFSDEVTVENIEEI